MTLCEHGYELALCRDTMPAELARDVEFAHSHAFQWAARYVGLSGIPDLNAAEGFASYVARNVARDGGLEYSSLPREFERWLLNPA